MLHAHVCANVIVNGISRDPARSPLFSSYGFLAPTQRVEGLQHSPLQGIPWLSASFCTCYEWIEVTVHYQRYAVEYGGHVLLDDLENW